LPGSCFFIFFGQKRPATKTTRIDARPLPSSYWPMWTESRGFQYISLKDSAWAIPWYPILSRIWCVARTLRQFCCLKHSIFTSIDCATALPSLLPAVPVSSEPPPLPSMLGGDRPKLMQHHASHWYWGYIILPWFVVRWWWWLLRYWRIKQLNSLTPKCVPAGMKNSRLEDFLLAKHTSHKHPHHDEPFSRLAAWFWWTNIPHPGNLFASGWMRPSSKGLV
jgi:hypothetical protein